MLLPKHKTTRSYRRNEHGCLDCHHDCWSDTHFLLPTRPPSVVALGLALEVGVRIGWLVCQLTLPSHCTALFVVPVCCHIGRTARRRSPLCPLFSWPYTSSELWPKRRVSHCQAACKVWSHLLTLHLASRAVVCFVKIPEVTDFTTHHTPCHIGKSWSSRARGSVVSTAAHVFTTSLSQPDINGSPNFICDVLDGQWRSRPGVIAIRILRRIKNETDAVAESKGLVLVLVDYLMLCESKGDSFSV